jgi:hypothetical protein
VQIDLVLQRPDAAPELADDVEADAAAAKRECIVGLEQRLDVERVGDRLGQRRRFVALALARDRERPARGSTGAARFLSGTTAPTAFAN